MPKRSLPIRHRINEISLAGQINVNQRPVANRCQALDFDGEVINVYVSQAFVIRRIKMDPSKVTSLRKRPKKNTRTTSIAWKWNVSMAGSATIRTILSEIVSVYQQIPLTFYPSNIEVFASRTRRSIDNLTNSADQSRTLLFTERLITGRFDARKSRSFISIYSISGIPSLGFRRSWWNRRLNS